MKKDMIKTCELFYSASQIPVFCYGKDHSFSFSCPKTSFIMDQHHLLAQESPGCQAMIHSDRNSLFWARISAEDHFFILGPVSMTYFSDRIIHALMSEHFIGNDKEEELRSILTVIPRLNLFRFSSAVQTLYQLLSSDYLPIEEIALADMLRSKKNKNEKQLIEKVLPSFYEAQDSGLELYDISYEEEQQMIRDIESGNIEALLKRFSAADAEKFGSLADTTIRSTKNMFIVVIALASRTAIQNGLSVQVAYKLSDLYIQEIEHASGFENLTALVRNAVVDYSQRIQALRVPKGISPLIHEGMRYIEQSVSQPLNVTDVAEHVGKSPSYYSALFKNETGININAYISKTKIEEAKRMLKYTDKSLIEISNFLWFSSQSHFQRVFKSLTGMTPLAYRKKNQKIVTDTDKKG